MSAVSESSDIFTLLSQRAETGRQTVLWLLRGMLTAGVYMINKWNVKRADTDAEGI